jgi:fatty acid desaturase
MIMMGDVIYSDFGLIIMFGVLGLVWREFGFAWLFYTYVVPYLIVNMWLVLITYLQVLLRYL